MATLEEIYAKALTDEGERQAFAQIASDPQAIGGFLAERGCDATPEEAQAFVKAKLAATSELAGEELSMASGGGDCYFSPLDNYTPICEAGTANSNLP